MSTVLITLWNPLAAGAPVMAVQFSIGLIEAGHRVVVVHGPRADSTATDVLDEMRDLGIDLVPLLPFSTGNLRANLRRALDAADEHGCDAVLAFQQSDRVLGALVARARRVPYVIHCGGRPMIHGHAFARRFKKRLQRWALRRADLVVCPSPAIESCVVRDFGVAAHKAPVLYNGIDTGAFAELAVTREVSHDGPLRMISVGRPLWEKGHDVALKALIECSADLPEWQYTIFGARTGDGNEAHNAAIDALMASPAIADRVSFAGWSTNIHAELGRADIYLHPSRSEGWSLAVCEALAAGTVSVLTDCSGRPPGFEDGVHGWIVASDDPVAYRDAVRAAVALSADDRRRVGEAAARYAAEHFDIVPCRRQVARWIEDLIVAGAR